ncbi:hypothetical protein Tco_0036243, partial [Tanacetum coccineum]
PDTTKTYDHYDVHFQGDRDRYMRDYAAYEHFVALCEQEAKGLRSGPKRRRTYIPREREDAEQWLIDNYFGDDEFLLKYPEENFRRRYRMSSTLFNKIVNNILSYDVQPLPEYFNYFRQRNDATGRLSIGHILKCTSAIRQLAYDTAPNAFDEYLQIAERVEKLPKGLAFVKMEKGSLGVVEHHEDEFTKLILSWSLDDILNEDLYKNKVSLFLLLATF